MDKLTVTEWLENEQLSADEIDFILTFIPFISVIKVQPDKVIKFFIQMAQTVEVAAFILAELVHKFA